MKETKPFSKNFSFLRTLFLFPALLSIFSFTACRKTAVEKEVRQDEAADVITYALEARREGLAAQLMIATRLVDSLYTSACGYTLDTLLDRKYAVDEGTTSYSSSHTLKLSCNGGSPETFSYKGFYNGAFAAPRMNSSNNGTWNWTFTDLGPSYTHYRCSGAFHRSGQHFSRIHKDSAYDVDLSISFSNLQIDKSNRQISGGKAVAIAECRLTGASYTQPFGGDITFHNDGTATLLLKAPAYKIQVY